MAQATKGKGSAEVRKPGRPRCPELETSIKKAALELLQLQGFANLTIEGVAARAGVGKATIYRWWPSKAHLVIEAFLERTTHQIPPASSGNVRQDVVEQLSALSALFSGPDGKVIGVLVCAAQQSEELAKILRSEWLARRRSVTLVTLQKGQANGQIRADVDLETLLDTLVGPFYLALFMGHRPIAEIDIEAHVASVFAGVEPSLS